MPDIFVLWFRDIGFYLPPRERQTDQGNAFASWGGSTHLDFLWDQESSRFHIVRFIGNQNDLGTIARLREFRKMVTILLNSSAEIITGTAASSNDPSIRMNESGNWRFQRLKTVWQGISASRLEKLWMRMGFIPEQLVGMNSSKLALLSPENALILSEEFKTRCPDSPSPFHYLCPKVSIYDHATLLKLKEWVLLYPFHTLLTGMIERCLRFYFIDPLRR